MIEVQIEQLHYEIQQRRLCACKMEQQEGYGIIEDTNPERTTITSNGKQIIRNGTADDSAVTNKYYTGVKVLT